MRGNVQWHTGRLQALAHGAELRRQAIDDRSDPTRVETARHLPQLSFRAAGRQLSDHHAQARRLRRHRPGDHVRVTHRFLATHDQNWK